jgi:hypothetical protein
MHPSTLAVLLKEPEAVTKTLLTLRQLLPGANISSIVCSYPQVVSPAHRESITEVSTMALALA